MKRKDQLLVSLQFILIAWMLLAPDDKQGWGGAHGLFTLIGVVLVLAGLAVLALSFLSLGKSLTAVPTPKAKGELKTTGMYRVVRHPIYSGLMLIAIGVALSDGPWPQLLIAALLISLLNYKARYEEVLLQKKYKGYAKYSAKTPRFIPKIRTR